ncbi:MAG: NAD-dependent epimerase/dehydratase family protein [Flavobacteriales bacterium]|nr:NAD-dependent epimerase/dehydratase family protein [Flavobacteriales bacterium]
MDLVTGGTGIVGAHVLNELLARDGSVRAIHRSTSDRDLVRRILRHYHADGDARFDRIQWVEGDLLDPDALSEAMSGIERVFHCAALVSFDARDREAMFRNNISGTANVVNAMLANGVQRLCHVSSTATIGARIDGSPNPGSEARVNEDVPFVSGKNASPYAVSKHEAEMEVQRGIAEGLHAVMVNPCVVIGPGANGRSSMTIIDRMRNGSRFFPRGSNAIVDARDVATAMVRMIDEGSCGERYLLIGENLTYKKLFGTVANAFGKSSPVSELHPWMLELAWRAEAARTLFGGRPMITKISARTASRTRNYDGSRARNLLAMNFRNVEEAVQNVARFLKAQ